MFETLGYLASRILDDVSERRRCNVSVRDGSSGAGELERVAFLRATDQARRIDALLLTEGYARNWSVRAQGEERMRQAHLVARARRQGVLGK
jgi:hypothetical protein